MEMLVNYMMSCGFDYEGAVKEVESIIRYNTTGVDAVSREYAIEMMLEDLDLI